MNEYKLIDASLVEDADGCHYLDLTYEYEDQYRISKVHFPMVRLPIERIGNINHIFISSSVRHEKVSIDFGTCDFDLELMCREFKDVDGSEYIYRVETIKEKTQKMTVAEIEKKLGYKIEIVAEK